MIGTVNVQLREVMVTCLPLDHDDAPAYSIRVIWCGDGDRWRCTRTGRYLNATGTWDRTSDDEDNRDWIAAHVFDYHTALRLAGEAAQTLSMNGVSVQDLLAALPDPTEATR